MKKTSNFPIFPFCLLVAAIFGLPGAYSQPENMQGIHAGFDTSSYHPVYIRSEDEQFLLNIGIYTQFRYNVNWLQNAPDTVDVPTTGYNLARTRIFFEGNLTPRFYYHIRTNVNSANTFELFVAYLQWNIRSDMWLRMGRQFMALGLEDWLYPQDLAAIEFSAQNFTYAIWSNFGFQFHHRPSSFFRYWAGIGNGAYGGRRNFPTPAPTDATLTGRFEYNLLGSDWGMWGDAIGRRGREFGMLLGLGLGQTFRRSNKAALTDADIRGGSQINLDFSMAGNGFHFFTHGTVTFRDLEEQPDQTLPSFYTTLGYWLSDHFFSYVRYDFVGKGNLDGELENYSSPGVGIAFYPFSWSNRYKFSLEYNYLNAAVNNTLVEPDGQLGLISSSLGGQQSLRFQAQFGF